MSIEAGPDTRLTLAYELRGPMDIICATTKGAAVTMPFSRIHPVIAPFLQGKTVGDYTNRPDVIRGPDELRAELVKRNVELEVTLKRDQMPAGSVEIGMGFSGQDEVGRDLPLVVTAVDGDDVKLTKIACLFFYRIDAIVPISASFSLSLGGPDEGSPMPALHWGE